jgi:hypothetical protein
LFVTVFWRFFVHFLLRLPKGRQAGCYPRIARRTEVSMQVRATNETEDTSSER